jgi:ADP-ribose pyrophosphatase YjhB (NUDIX family)
MPQKQTVEEEEAALNIRQIFASYEYGDSFGHDGMRYCPSCGNRLDRRPEGKVERPFCAKCGFVLYRNPAPAVSVLIPDDGRVLLGKRAAGSFAAGKWCLPCGYIEYNEDFLSAAVREVREETGLLVSPYAIASVNSNFLSRSIHSLVVVLLARVEGGAEQPGDDIARLGWFVPDSLPELAFEADAHIIERYFAGGIPLLETDGRFGEK